MTGPLRLLIRLIARLRLRSKTETAMIPISGISHAVVIVDSRREDASSTEKVVRRYFEGKGIMVDVFAPSEDDISWAGYYKKAIRGTRKAPRTEDLYMNLVPDETSYAIWFDALCSPARFKVGCCNYKKDLFNLIINIPDGRSYTQIEVFAAMIDCMERIIE